MIISYGIEVFIFNSSHRVFLKVNSDIVISEEKDENQNINVKKIAILEEIKRDKYGE